MRIQGNFNFRRAGRFGWMLAAGLIAAAVVSSPAPAQTLTTLVKFDNTNGRNPYGGLIADADGNLFGTTRRGGTYTRGTVFKIAKTAGGYASTPTTLVSFDVTNGADPYSSLIADANGNLFGTTLVGGAYGAGTVFEIVKTAGGYASAPTVLVSFNGANGRNPYAGLIVDANGNLFGTTRLGGTSNKGTVFEIVNTGGSYAGTPTILFNFDGVLGQEPYAGLIADADGNLFGTAYLGGVYGYGTVFKIAKTAGGYASTPTVLFNFDVVNGSLPYAGLTADANGDLFGTTINGGAHGYGTVFKIAKTAGGYASTPNTLFSFDVTSGTGALGALIADVNGSLFGTTANAGSHSGGTVFKIAKTAGGYATPPPFCSASISSMARIHTLA